ncbi:MAG: hypothetical protein HY979_02130 [Candidatus Magasanikbacteria bacterium]|nr:hypothetical protein [Candidatus Magasanikbacteria bacterium]
MLRKAKIDKNAPFNAEMAETYFAAIKVDFDSLRSELDQFKVEIDAKLTMILDIVKFYDLERKEIKSNLWEHDKRLMKLERV